MSKAPNSAAAFATSLAAGRVEKQANRFAGLGTAMSKFFGSPAAKHTLPAIPAAGAGAFDYYHTGSLPGAATTTLGTYGLFSPAVHGKIRGDAKYKMHTQARNAGLPAPTPSAVSAGQAKAQMTGGTLGLLGKITARSGIGAMEYAGEKGPEWGQQASDTLTSLAETGKATASSAKGVEDFINTLTKSGDRYLGPDGKPVELTPEQVTQWKAMQPKKPQAPAAPLDLSQVKKETVPALAETIRTNVEQGVEGVGTGGQALGRAGENVEDMSSHVSETSKGVADDVAGVAGNLNNLLESGEAKAKALASSDAVREGTRAAKGVADLSGAAAKAMPWVVGGGLTLGGLYMLNKILRGDGKKKPARRPPHRHAPRNVARVSIKEPGDYRLRVRREEDEEEKAAMDKQGIGLVVGGLGALYLAQRRLQKRALEAAKNPIETLQSPVQAITGGGEQQTATEKREEAMRKAASWAA